jgi:hypothetical protein
VGKLKFEHVQKMSLNTRLLQRVEVPAWAGNVPLLPGVDLAEDIEYDLSPKVPAKVFDGDLKKALEVLRKLMKIHPLAPIVVAVVLGAPAIARWHKNDRFGLALWGKTGSFKTTTVLLAMGIFGVEFTEGPKLTAGKMGSTTIGATEVFAVAGFLAQLLDNVKTVDPKDAMSYIAVMHSVVEGEEKARGKKEGGLRDSREYSCIPIATGEVRPQEASTTARVLNLNWGEGADADVATEVRGKVDLLPVLGYHWLRFLAGTDCVL